MGIRRKFSIGWIGENIGSPDKLWGRGNIYLLGIENTGLLALARLILPQKLLDNFEVVRIDEKDDLISIHLNEVTHEIYAHDPKIESKGFLDPITVRDFPIRNRGVDLVVRRRRWLDKTTGKTFSKTYKIKADGTRYSKDFAAFFKYAFGDDPIILPYA